MHNDLLPVDVPIIKSNSWTDDQFWHPQSSCIIAIASWLHIDSQQLI